MPPPSFPAEAWTSILRFACEGSADLDENFNFAPDWTLLDRAVCGDLEQKLHYSLVSRSFRDLMKHNLYEAIFISRRSSAMHLADFFDGKQSQAHLQQLGSRTRILVVDLSDDGISEREKAFQDVCAALLRILRHCQNLKAFAVTCNTASYLQRELLASVLDDMATLIPSSITHFAWKEPDSYCSREWLSTLFERTSNLRCLYLWAFADDHPVYVDTIAPRLPRLTHMHMHASQDNIWFINEWQLPVLHSLILRGEQLEYEGDDVLEPEYTDRPTLRSVTLVDTEDPFHSVLRRVNSIAPGLTELSIQLVNATTSGISNDGKRKLETLRIGMKGYPPRYKVKNGWDYELRSFMETVKIAHSPVLRHVIFHDWPEPVKGRKTNAVMARIIYRAFEHEESILLEFQGIPHPAHD